MPQQNVDKIERTALSEDMPPRDAEELSMRDGMDDSLSVRARLAELESEHFHLQRLVAELLIKNQKLRELLCEQSGTSAAAASFCRGDGAMHHGHASSH
jgi:hypothetical protein